MKLKALLDEALQKGEKVKEDLLVEIVNSKLFNELLKNEKFIHAVTAVVQTKEEVSKILHQRIKQVFHLMDIPTRKEVEDMMSKLVRIEHQIDRAGQQARIAAGKRAAQKTVAQSSQRKTAAKKSAIKKSAATRKVKTRRKAA